MSRLLLALSLVLMLVLLADGTAKPQAANKEDDKLVAFFKDHLAKEFKERPLEATRLGNHDFDHLLDDISPKARAGWVKRILFLSDRRGDGLFTDRIIYGEGEPRMEVWYHSQWMPLESRDGKRGLVLDGNWRPMTFTNGAWSPRSN
jgi:hypothetical protein